jgi:hypothetical protein
MTFPQQPDELVKVGFSMCHRLRNIEVPNLHRSGPAGVFRTDCSHPDYICAECILSWVRQKEGTEYVDVVLVEVNTDTVV